jgi:DNA-directed RNA polymerase subunit RPC12/RpoP
MAVRDIQVTLTFQVEEMAAMICTDCDYCLSLDDDLDPRYECGSCGEEFNRSESADGDSNRCPSCNKFGAKIADADCPECGEGMERDIALICPRCNSSHHPDAMADHIIDCAI